jgi:3-deoxy-D-arabino-heptulosonate 7-phosphate (DAHP) synthase class II
LEKLSDDVEWSTIIRNVTTAEEPKRISLIHQIGAKLIANTTPKMIKKSHKAQEKRERAIILLKL